jgi:hypothetical protein
VHDGAHEWVSDGRIPLARVLRPRGRGLDAEFVVPSWMSVESVVPLAHALWHVLAPLMGRTSHDVGGARHASHPAWLPSAHRMRVPAAPPLLAG